MENNETLASTCFTPSTNSPVTNLRAILDNCVEKGMINRADTWEELSQQIGVDAEAMLNTIESYNGYGEKGEDPDFNKDPAKLIPMDAEGPYYTIKMVGGMLTTTGGVKINEEIQVVNKDGAVIPLLYCIGTDAGGFYAETYNFMDSGCCSTFSFLSGSTAAENEAKEQGIEVESIYG